MLAARQRRSRSPPRRARSSPRAPTGTTTRRSTPRAAWSCASRPRSPSGRPARVAGAGPPCLHALRLQRPRPLRLLRRRRRGAGQRAQHDSRASPRRASTASCFEADGIAYPELCDRLVKLAQSSATRRRARTSSSRAYCSSRTSLISIWKRPGSSFAGGGLVIQIRNDWAGSRAGSTVSRAAPVARPWPPAGPSRESRARRRAVGLVDLGVPARGGAADLASTWRSPCSPASSASPTPSLIPPKSSVS